MKRWYLVAVKPNMSRKVEVNLRNQGVETYRPLLRSDDGRGERTELAFPQYVFARFDAEYKSMASVNFTPGVNRLVSFGGIPAIVHDEILEQLRLRFDHNVLDTRLHKGDKVIIAKGPFAGINAVFYATNRDERTILLVQMVNRTHHIEVDREYVERL